MPFSLRAGAATRALCLKSIPYPWELALWIPSFTFIKSINNSSSINFSLLANKYDQKPTAKKNSSPLHYFCLLTNLPLSDIICFWKNNLHWIFLLLTFYLLFSPLKLASASSIPLNLLKQLWSINLALVSFTFMQYLTCLTTSFLLKPFVDAL